MWGLLWRHARVDLRVPRGAWRAGRARVRAALDTDAAVARGRGAAQHARRRRAAPVARAGLVPRRARATIVPHRADGAHRLKVRQRAHVHRRYRHPAMLLRHDGHRARPRAPLCRGQLDHKGAALRARGVGVLEGVVDPHDGHALGGARVREARHRACGGRCALRRARGRPARPRSDCVRPFAAAMGARGRLPLQPTGERVQPGATDGADSATGALHKQDAGP